MRRMERTIFSLEIRRLQEDLLNCEDIGIRSLISEDILLLKEALEALDKQSSNRGCYPV